MNECGRIADQLRRSYEGGAWHGPSLKEVLAEVDAAAAARRPSESVHTIWELVLHVAVWAGEARRVLQGHEYESLEGTADWPIVSGSWDEALAHLEREQRGLVAESEQFPEERLREQISGQKGYTIYILLHGIVQHNLYHAGQIALIKKLP